MRLSVYEDLLACANAVRPSAVSPVAAVESMRKGHGFTATQMSKLLHMKPSHYSEFVAGLRALPRVAMYRAHAIGLPGDAMLAMPPAPADQSCREPDGRCGICGGDWSVCGCDGMLRRAAATKEPQQ